MGRFKSNRYNKSDDWMERLSERIFWWTYIPRLAAFFSVWQGVTTIQGKIWFLPCIVLSSVLLQYLMICTVRIPKHYLSFSKTPGSRVTEIKLESRKQLIETEGQVEFKLAPLFEGHKLDIENVILEFESFWYTVYHIRDQPFTKPVKPNHL